MSIGKKSKYIPSRHQYYLFLVVSQANPIVDVCIYNAIKINYNVAKLLDNDLFVG